VNIITDSIVEARWVMEWLHKLQEIGDICCVNTTTFLSFIYTNDVLVESVKDTNHYKENQIWL
jgi:hypothetical protein